MSFRTARHMARNATVRCPTAPQPLYHVTVPMPVEGMEGWTARVLCLQHPGGEIEVFRPLLKYFKAHPTRSSSWQDTAAQAIGLLWDYSVATRETRPNRGARDLFRDFALSLAKGTIATDCTDPTGLYWPSTPYARCKGLIKAIEKFAGWCDYEAGSGSPLAPDYVPLIPQTGEHVAAMIRWSRLREGSMLKHIAHAPRSQPKSIVEHGREPAGRSAEPVKFFPPEHAARLIWEGYKIPGAELEANVFHRYNVRNMMIALLDGWGGLRRSEGLHLWVQDVVEDPNNLDHALVVLNHPAESKVEFTDPISLRVETMTRREFLKRQYGLLPRNDVTRGGFHAGWKGMDLDPRYQSCVFWIDPDAGRLFWALYWGYLNYVRTPIMAERIKAGGGDHPFLFVSIKGDENGEGSAFPENRTRKARTNAATRLRSSVSVSNTRNTQAPRRMRCATCTARRSKRRGSLRRSSRRDSIIATTCRRCPTPCRTTTRSARSFGRPRTRY
ncbi:hypothetical protein ACQ86E_19575 [Bradyrhizobium betae]|uniref:hypothetical protein n=1 Tax=Bradyrhizobium betae TaxID=244734 RepID=UPI003D679D42